MISNEVLNVRLKPCFLVGLGLFLSWTILFFGQSSDVKPEAKAADTRSATAAASAATNPNPSNSPDSSVDAAKKTKEAAKAKNKKKAQELLNRCYQEALGTPPATQAETLQHVAEAMQKIDKEKAVQIYQQAFAATQQLDASDRQVRKDAVQFNLVLSMSGLDVEKALQLAQKMDIVYPSPDDPNPSPLRFRNNALSMLASRLAGKDPERAFQLVEDQITQGNYDPSFIAPVAIALSKTHPQQAEQLFIEAIHQFEKPTDDFIQVQSFVNLTSRLFDLNHSLSQQAVELILKEVDRLQKKQKEDNTSFVMTSVNSQGKSYSVNSMAEYAAVQAIAMMRRLDPERAKQLEEQYADFRNSIAKNPNGLFPFGNTPDPTSQTSSSESSAPGGTASNPSTGQRTVNQERTIFISTGGSSGSSGASQPKPDPSQLTSQIQNQMKLNQAARLATTDPNAALNMVTQLTNPTDQAKALARIGVALANTDPEKAKGLLSDAYTAAQKVEDPYDRAQILGYVGDGYSQLDPARAQTVLGEAFHAADQVVEEQAKNNSGPGSNLKLTLFQPADELFKQLVSALAKINIDAAIARSEQISDQKSKLMALVQVAGIVLNDGVMPDTGMRIMVSSTPAK
ncbi:MAG: hypothetical protein PHX83_09255 [Acidobacteriia bacterium]|nr:hypothetical protein [Terriglobia bacterium]